MNNTKRPKRRKKKDNPYTLIYEGKYEIEIRDNNRIDRVTVSKEVYEEFNKFELDDKKEMNEYDRNIHFEFR